MNEIELSAVLFYADFLSLEHSNQTVTDTCKYYWIYGVPINACIIAGVQPEYDINNYYFQQAYKEFMIIEDKFGIDGIYSFLGDLCNLRITGSVNAEQMLKYIYRFDTKKKRNKAFEKYRKFIKNQTYKHITYGIDGPEETECTKYVAHTEQSKRLGK